MDNRSEPGRARGFACAFVGAMAVAGCASATPPPPATPSLPARSAATRVDIVLLLAEAIAHEFCPKVQGRFLPLSSAATDGPQAGESPVLGRWWIWDCATFTHGGVVGLRMGGPGWMWAEREEYGHTIRQYVYFRSSTTVWGVLDATFAPNPHVVSLWFSPVAPAQVAAGGIGRVTASGHGVLGTTLDVVDFFTFGALIDVDGRARQKVNEEAARRFREQLSRGFTITYSFAGAQDIAHGQVDVGLGPLPAGMAPLRPIKDGRPWLAHERLELHNAFGAYHVLGPFEPALGADVDVDVESGNGIMYRAECAADVAQWFSVVNGGETPKLPLSRNSQTGLVSSGQATRRITLPTCKWYLIVEASQGDTRASVRVRANTATFLIP